MLQVSEIFDKNLMELIQAEEEAYDLATENGGEVSPDLSRVMDYIEARKEDKYTNIARMLLNWRAEEAAYHEQIQRLKKKKDGLVSRQEWMKQYLKDAMKAEGKTKVGNGPSISLQNNSQPSLVVDESMIPHRYMQWVSSPNKPALREDLIAGASIPGAKLEKGQHIRAKV